MGTVPIGTGELRRIHSRVVWMSRPVERSITVSAPHLVAHSIFSTSSSMEEVTAEFPMLALIFTRKFRPIIIGSDSGWLILDGMMARPAGNLLPHVIGVDTLTDADELHLWGNNPFPGIAHLRGGFARVWRAVACGSAPGKAGLRSSPAEARRSRRILPRRPGP